MRAHRVGQRQSTNLDALPSQGFEVAAFPLKIVGASAAPARVEATLR
jgi:kynurenine formamidase